MWHRDRRGACRVLVGDMERDHLKDVRIDGSIILKGAIKETWNGIIWLRIRAGDTLMNAVMKRFP